MMEAKGSNGVISFDGRIVRITRRGVRGMSLHGKGDKAIPLQSLGSVQMKPAGRLSEGFLQFGVVGGVERNTIRRKRTYGGEGAVSDENSVMFKRKHQPEFEAVRNAILEALSQP